MLCSLDSFCIFNQPKFSSLRLRWKSNLHNSSIMAAGANQPISDTHGSAALELFFAPVNGACGSLVETYKTVKNFEVRGLDGDVDLKAPACRQVVENPCIFSFYTKDIFFALKIKGILKCQIDFEVLIKDASLSPRTLKLLSRMQAHYLIFITWLET